MSSFWRGHSFAAVSLVGVRPNSQCVLKQARNFGPALALCAWAYQGVVRSFRWRPNEATQLKRQARARTSVNVGKISPRSKPRREGSMDQRLPASVSRVPFSLSSAQRGSDPLGFCQLPRQKFSRHRDDRAAALALLSVSPQHLRKSEAEASLFRGKIADPASALAANRSSSDLLASADFRVYLRARV